MAILLRKKGESKIQSFSALRICSMLYLLGFIYLDFADRARYLLTHGRYLTSRIEGDFEVQLYWTPNFFAEVYFSPVRHRNEKISAVTENPFDDYLAYISLPQLLSQ